MRIGELAEDTGTPIETIRYYEREGLLPAPARSEGNYRLYEAAHAQRLSFIRHCRALDMNLDEVRVLLRFKDAPSENCTEVNEVLDDHIRHVSERVKELRALERELRALREQCDVASEAACCGILNGLTDAAEAEQGRQRLNGSHVGALHSKRTRAGSRRTTETPSRSDR